MSMLRTGSRLVVAAAVLVSLAAFVAPAAMAADGTRVLDLRLSLIGGCEKEELDWIEDPGCPTTPPAGEHPPTLLDFPRSVATDLYGDIYVANWGKKNLEQGPDGRIDIFNPDGRYIGGIPKGVVPGPRAIAVDSVGTLYVWLYEGAPLGPIGTGHGELLRFEPCLPYDPTAGEIEYCEPPSAVTLAGPDCPEPTKCQGRGSIASYALAINPENDHLFLERNMEVVEYGSAAEGNEELRTMFNSGMGSGTGVGIAVDAAHDKLYSENGSTIEIFKLVEGLAAQEPYEKIGVIEPSAVPLGQMGGNLGLAADEGTGSLYAYDSENSKVFEFDEAGNYVATISDPLQAQVSMGIAIDNGPYSPNGKLSEDADKGRYLYVPSHPKTSPGHLFAFFVSQVGPPKVKSVEAVNVSEDEAKLRASINPGNLPTTYTFEFQAEGAAAWTSAGAGAIPAGNLDVEVSASARGLAPGVRYRFRVVATNEKGSEEAEGDFATYPNLAPEPSPCPNALLRTGVAALLPDCRAYELVTPPNTDGHPPKGLQNYAGGASTRQVSPAGDRVGFRIEGGSLPGFNATGALYGDNYFATRAASGWSTSLGGLTGSEAIAGLPGTGSPDQGYFFSQASSAGPAVMEGKTTSYVTYPDGHSELLGRGSLGIAPGAVGQLIGEGGGHIIFSIGPLAGSDLVKLEPDAAPNGTWAVYDRTADGSTHVISLKPGDLPFGADEDAVYKGASFDGKGVAFVVDGTLYLRYNNEQTFEIGDGVEFAGIAEGGGRVFYLENGNLKAFDVSAPTTPIMFANAAAEVVPVTVSADGSTAYFLSESAIPGAGSNPQGVKPKAGEQNLYRSEEGDLAFLGTVTERDVEGVNEFGPGLGDGLGLWLEGLEGGNNGLGMVPARSTPDGGVFLFKSRAFLTEYDSEGYAEIYRYDAGSNQLQCLSCNPTGTPPGADATLQSSLRVGWHAPWPENLRPDGRRAFFETSEPLVARDSDGLEDVYEWEAQGVGSCSRPEGCLYLISSPQSRLDEHLFAVSSSGDDVFFLSSDRLLAGDPDETPSIYDARVGGGFAEPTEGACEGEGCRPQLATPPSLPTGATSVQAGRDVKPRRCGKGKRKVKRGGKVRCVKKKHHRKRDHRRAGAGQKGAHR
jgi:hypothetical protein